MLRLSDIVRLVSAVRIMGSQHFIGRNPPKNTNSQKFDENIEKNLSMSKKGLQYSLRDVHNSICAKGVRSQAKKEWAKSWEKIFFQKSKYIYIYYIYNQFAYIHGYTVEFKNVPDSLCTNGRT